MISKFEGAGLGLRSSHIANVIRSLPPVSWWEVITENYFRCSEINLKQLEKIRQNYPIVFHGVGLNLGAAENLSGEYLQKLGGLIERFDPIVVSDHLCWTGIQGFSSHDLLPLPATREVLQFVSAKIQQVQEAFRRPLVLENISSYVHFKENEMTEGEFFTALTARTDCRVLLDINNLYVNGHNFGFDPAEELKRYPLKSLAYIHVADHQDWGTHLVDTHSGYMCSEVENLLIQAWDQCGDVPAVLEWDRDLPELPKLIQSYEKLNGLYHSNARGKNGFIPSSETMD